MQITVLEIAQIQTQETPWFTRRLILPQALQDLARSIDESGLLHPIAVRSSRASDSTFELIYGSRRLVATSRLGRPTIPARILEVTDAEAARIAFAENLGQEGDLSVLERGWAVTRLRDLRRTAGLPFSDHAIADEIGFALKATSICYARMIAEVFPESRIRKIASTLDVEEERLVALDQASLRQIIKQENRDRDEALLALALRASQENRSPATAVRRALNGTPEPVNRIDVGDDGGVRVRLDSPPDDLPGDVLESILPPLENYLGQLRHVQDAREGARLAEDQARVTQEETGTARVHLHPDGRIEIGIDVHPDELSEEKARWISERLRAVASSLSEGPGAHVTPVETPDESSRGLVRRFVSFFGKLLAALPQSRPASSRGSE